MRLPGTREALLSGIAAIAMTAIPVGAKAPPPVTQNGPQSDFPVTVGDPYQIGGVTFVPSDSMNFDSVGYASVAGQGGTAIAAAHHTLPVPSYAEVTDLRTGRTILVRIDRRGPMDGTHAIELSPGAAAQLGIATDGRAPVRVRRVNPPEAERGLLRAGEPAPERMATPKPLLDVLMRKLNPALAQRALDAADEDAGPAKAPPAAPIAPGKVAPAPKPIPTAKPTLSAKPVVPPKPAPLLPPAPVPAARDPLARVGASGAPPRGYVPSVPAPGDAAPAKTRHGKPAPVEAPVKSEAPKPEKTAPTARSAEHDKDKPDGSFLIQAGAFSQKTRAQSVADKIGGTVSQAGKVWRVRVGPYAGHGSAEAALAKVKSAGYSDARIQRAE
jgi:rare lipoprotein A